MINHAYTIATMRHSTKQQRKSRKRDLFKRIKKMVKRYDGTESSLSFIIPCIRTDIEELMQIAKVEGIQQGYKEYQDKYGEQNG